MLLTLEEQTDQYNIVFLIKKEYFEDIEDLTAKDMKGPDIPY